MISFEDCSLLQFKYQKMRTLDSYLVHIPTHFIRATTHVIICKSKINIIIDIAIFAAAGEPIYVSINHNARAHSVLFQSLTPLDIISEGGHTRVARFLRQPTEDRCSPPLSGIGKRESNRQKLGSMATR